MWTCFDDQCTVLLLWSQTAFILCMMFTSVHLTKVISGKFYGFSTNYLVSKGVHCWHAVYALRFYHTKCVWCMGIMKLYPVDIYLCCAYICTCLIGYSFQLHKFYSNYTQRTKFEWNWNAWTLSLHCPVSTACCCCLICYS